MGRKEKLFLGIDLSTQSLKAIIINSNKEGVAEALVNFDVDLPEYRTSGGVHRHEDGLTVTSPAIMWVRALDLLLERLQSKGTDFAALASLSGSGQQHGTVYLRQGTDKKLSSLNPQEPIYVQMEQGFAVNDSPVWMDSSTSEECRSLEKRMGGAQALATITGSRAYERFSGNQIARIFRTNRRGYDATERIALVSSFAASLFAGRYASIDWSDGSGMNLMNIRSRKWDETALNHTAPDLAERLGVPRASYGSAGNISGYFVVRYSFDPSCLVVNFSGDNPCSLAGLRLEEPGDVAVSMGTSDTLFASLSDPRPSADEGHIFAGPIDPSGYMAMICYKNGSLTREDVRDSCAAGRWSEFSAMLERTQPGNGGNIGFYFKEPEITPPVLASQYRRFDARNREREVFAPQEDARAVIEGQFLSMRLHGATIGIQPRRILATGGGSRNTAILRVMSQVFGVPVLVGDVPDSAALGAAYRALHGYECFRQRRFIPFAEAIAGAPSFKKVFDEKEHPVYGDMLLRYKELERVVRGEEK
jgi:xylulokinase